MRIFAISNFKPDKIIKKTIKILFVFILVILTLPTIAYFVIQNNKVQQYLVQKMSGKLSDLFGSSFSMDSARVDIFNNYHFYNFLVRDLHNDTLIFSPEFIIVPNSFSITSKFVEIQKLELKNPKIYFNIDSSNVINLQFIADKLASKDTTGTKPGWSISFKNIKISDGILNLKHAIQNTNNAAINFSNLGLSKINIHVTGLRTGGNSGVEIKIKEFSATEKSGFTITKLKSRLRINRENLVFNNLRLITPNSAIDADQIRLNFKLWKHLNAENIAQKVKMNFELNSSEFSSLDLAYFVPALNNYNLKLGITGKIQGTINDFKGKNLEITYGDNTILKGNIDINGLPDIHNSFLHIDIKKLQTTTSDIENFRLPNPNFKHIQLPKNFNQFKYLRYKGKFTGFISDFVAYGTISTNLGNIDSDISVKPDTARTLIFNGKLKMNNFQLGKYLWKEDQLGNISLNVMANGKIYGIKNFNINIDGTVSSFYYQQYNYQNIHVDGKLSNNTYMGNLTIHDPNIDLSFNGNVDFTKTVPIFNFEANVRKAYLYNLNLDKKDTSAMASFYATANFEGNTIDNIHGEIKLWNSTFRKEGRQIEINDFLLFTQNVNENKLLVLRSNFADAEILGNYRFYELFTSLKALSKNYFPSLINGNVSDSAVANDFKFEIDLKDTRQLTDFLIPGFYISKDSKLTGNYNAQERDLNFQIKIPLLQHLSRKWYNVYFNGKANRDSFSLVSGCRNLKLTNQLNFENFTILSNFKKDSIYLALRWNNWDTIAYKGNIKMRGLVSKGQTSSKPYFNFTIDPSQLILQDTIWDLTTGTVLTDSAGILVNQFELAHKTQKIRASGKLSNQKDDNLIVEVENLDLSQMKTVVSPQNLTLEGVVNGKVKFSDIFTKPDLFAALTIQNFTINDNNIGLTNLKANWNSATKSIYIDASSKSGNLQPLKATGDIFIEKKELDIDIVLNKLNLGLFDPFLSKIFSDISGTATGKLNLKGQVSSPLLNGQVYTDTASLTVNYLQTKYFLNQQTIPIQNNTFKFNQTRVLDEKNNRAFLNGSIELEHFKNVNLDLRIEASNFQCLKTTENNNSLYYGTAYASGNIKISGKAPQIKIDITATTKRNTEVFIPLLTKSDLAESNFIRIIKKQTEENPFDKYEINIDQNKIKESSETSNLKLNLNLIVTPDADVQIIFDQKVGDIIQGTGNGNFSIIYDGKFNMFGIYTIEQGNYLFTLQNYINKRFQILPGGTLSWNGDPMDANLKIEASYRIDAPLYPLFATNEVSSSGNPSLDQYRKRIPIDCRIWLSDKLLNPNIEYDIHLPSSDQNTRTQVENIINNEEEKSLQFISLLFQNSFISPSNGNVFGNSQQTSPSLATAGNTGLEFLSNQFSNMISNASKNFDLGFNYYPGDEISNEEIAIALSTRIFDDKLSITYNNDVAIGNNKQVSQFSNTTNNIVGDVNVEYKVTNKLRAKVFNRSNENYFDNYSSANTQGIGIFYKEDFYTFKELFTKYYLTLLGRKKKTNTQKEEKENNTDSTDLQNETSLLP